MARRKGVEAGGAMLFNADRIPRGIAAWVLVVWSIMGTAVAADTPHEATTELLDELTNDPAWAAQDMGVSVIRVSDGEVLFESNADELRVPASAAKLVTAAAALDSLGPSFTFVTEVWATGDVVDGTLEGDLYVRGGGDPTLVQERIWRLLGDLRRDGIASIDGDIIFDDSRFSGDPQIPGWTKPRDLADGPSYFPSIGALGLDFGTVTLVVRPGTEPGKAATVEPEAPYGSAIRWDNQVVTDVQGRRRDIDVVREVNGRTLNFVLSGSIPVNGDTVRIRRAVHDPTSVFMQVFDDLRRQQGMDVTGELRRASVPADAERLRVIYSPPLASVLMDTNKYSSNFMAEMVLRTLGAETSGEGSNEQGLVAVEAYLAKLGFSAEAYRMKNGSGLSRETMMPPHLLTAVIRDMVSNWQVGPEFVASMAIAGVDGTLRKRMRDHAGAVRGKTGTLDGVHCLAGVLQTASGETLAYSILVNDIAGRLSRVKDLQDRFLSIWLMDGHGGETK